MELRETVEVEIRLDVEGPSAIGYGSDGKAGLCAAGEGRAALLILGDDLSDPDARERMQEEARRLLDRPNARPQVAAHDLHPDFFTTRLAGQSGLLTVPVQHHHAHMAAVMAEHALPGPTIGVTFDGMGLGEDGGPWGGEFLVGDLSGFVRAGHLKPVAQPGGDAAAREPWRMALSLLVSAFGDGWEKAAAALIKRQDLERCRTLVQALRRGISSPMTTSAGRLFEGAASILGMGDVNHSPAAVAQAMERAAKGSDPVPLAFDVKHENGRWVVDPGPVIRELAAAVLDGCDAGPFAAGFHLAMARMTAEVCERIREERRVKTVALGGGVFMNRLLSEWSRRELLSRGFEVYLGEAVPVHDGGLALGQAAIAMTKTRGGKS